MRERRSPAFPSTTPRIRVAYSLQPHEPIQPSSRVKDMHESRARNFGTAARHNLRSWAAAQPRSLEGTWNVGWGLSDSSLGAQLQPSLHVSPAVVEIMGPKYVGVMTLTCHGHVMSSVTWPPFDLPYLISYWWSFGTEHLFVSVFEIYPKHIAIALQSPIWNGLSLQVICVFHVFNVFYLSTFFIF